MWDEVDERGCTAAVRPSPSRAAAAPAQASRILGVGGVKRAEAAVCPRQACTAGREHSDLGYRAAVIGECCRLLIVCTVPLCESILYISGPYPKNDVKNYQGPTTSRENPIRKYLNSPTTFFFNFFKM